MSRKGWNSPRRVALELHERSRQLDHRCWAPAALLEEDVDGPGMGGVEGSNALGVRPLEAVNRLVVVADDREVAVLAQQVDQFLFGAVEILVLVDEYVVVSVKFRRLRIVLEVVERHGTSSPISIALCQRRVARRASWKS